ncbi:MAG: ester cyclase [Actinomycetota bacterium]|nr:ester cyclase [Actinomycetota bacterium]
MELLNAQDFDALSEVVDPERYREIRVGFTPGWVDLQEAVASLERVVGGIPDLNARIDDLVSEGDKVYARLTVTGTNSGRFFGAPPTGRSYEVSMFDYARLRTVGSSSASSRATPSHNLGRCTRGPPRRLRLP